MNFNTAYLIHESKQGCRSLERFLRKLQKRQILVYFYFCVIHGAEYLHVYSFLTFEFGFIIIFVKTFLRLSNQAIREEVVPCMGMSV
ncbi:unnamed protein product [Moneuplotes crassus]|uniref:Uncharacterized protein n=1 Tax=Euplotes crassus TaxID=5936 RepID=A0AAD1XUB5_EUPCR|nr:unnamed protein product [Moneuplotes crassus]